MTPSEFRRDVERRVARAHASFERHVRRYAEVAARTERRLRARFAGNPDYSALGRLGAYARAFWDRMRSVPSCPIRGQGPRPGSRGPFYCAVEQARREGRSLVGLSDAAWRRLHGRACGKHLLLLERVSKRGFWAPASREARAARDEEE